MRQREGSKSGILGTEIDVLLLLHGDAIYKIYLGFLFYERLINDFWTSYPPWNYIALQKLSQNYLVFISLPHLFRQWALQEEYSQLIESQ